VAVPSILILGATSTIARAVAAEFAAHQHDLLLAGRDQEELSALAADLHLRHGIRTKTQPFDVLDFEGHESSLGSCLLEAGEALEGVVLCVGYLGDQEQAQADSQEAKHILDINFTGCVSALNVVANHFERRRKGFICVLSSVAGDRGRQSNYLYGAAKGGLSVYLQGLRNRLFRSNVRVITIKPGFVDTRMTFGRPNRFLVASPQTVARGIYRAVVQRKDVVYLPWFWRWIMLAVRAVPERVFKRLHT
jgi:decaprenylphospho-beta-D-erythro-pentofuranosid-2-ulose 2-reductase